MSDYLQTADVWTILDLVVAEWTSDPMSVQCFDLRIVRRATELVKNHRPKPPVNDEDIVMRFRTLFAQTWPTVPDEADAGERQKKSRVVTMMLRAVMQELVAHLGPKTKPITFVVGKEAEKAILEEVQRRIETPTPN